MLTTGQDQQLWSLFGSPEGLFRPSPAVWFSLRGLSPWLKGPLLKLPIMGSVSATNIFSVWLAPAVAHRDMFPVAGCTWVVSSPGGQCQVSVARVLGPQLKHRNWNRAKQSSAKCCVLWFQQTWYLQTVGYGISHSSCGIWTHFSPAKVQKSC